VGWTVDRWNNSFIQTFVQLKDDIPYQDVVQKISEYLHNKPTIGKRLTKDGKQYKNEKIFLLTTDN